MSILPNCHSNQAASFACAQAGCPTCLAALVRENKGLTLLSSGRTIMLQTEYSNMGAFNPRMGRMKGEAGASPALSRNCKSVDSG